MFMVIGKRSTTVSDDQRGSSPVVQNIKGTSGLAKGSPSSALATCAVKDIM